MPHDSRAAAPQYRFHGSTPPKSGKRTPLLAQVNGTVSGDGVATIHLYDPIDSWGGDWGVSAKEFVAALAEIPDATEIRLHINSPGGEVFEAVAILNALRRHPANVVATVDGLAASAASFIAAGADELVMGQNGQLMIHDGWGIAIGPAADMHAMGDLLDKLSNNIAAIYADKAGGEIQAWRDLMLAETWFNDDEAVAVGLADRVESIDAPKNSFDTATLFKYQNRDEAPAPRVEEIQHAPAAVNVAVVEQNQRLNARRMAAAT
jgi:ATP-dependent protease ClpP protease subunit